MVYNTFLPASFFEDESKKKPESTSTKNYEKFDISGYECYLVKMDGTIFGSGSNYYCGYIKVPTTSVFVGKDYDCLNMGPARIPIDTEWTYSGVNIPKCPAAGYGWFFGFDFMHADDVVVTKNEFMSFKSREHAVAQFEKAVRLMKLNQSYADGTL